MRLPVYGVPIGGSSAAAASTSLSAGYYLRKGTGAPDYPDPTVANFSTSTTKFNDVGVNDHTTYEEQAVTAVVSEQAWVQALYVGSASASISTYTASLYYGASATITCKYWTGSAWGDFTGFWPGHIGFTWEDGSQDPADRTTQYLLLTVDQVSDGNAGAVRIGDFRPA